MLLEITRQHNGKSFRLKSYFCMLLLICQHFNGTSVAELSKREQNVIEVVLKHKKNDNILQYCMRRFHLLGKYFKKMCFLFKSSWGSLQIIISLEQKQLKNLLMLCFLFY